MDDPLLVRGLECLGNLPSDRDRDGRRHRSARNDLRQILTLDQFHHQGAHTAGFLEPVDVGDVRMVQCGEGPRFARESRQLLCIVRHGSGRILIATSRLRALSRAR